MPRIVPEFGKRVRALREKHGLTLRAMQYRTEISNPYLLEMQEGRVPSEVYVIKFASAFGEDVAEWLRLAGYTDLADRMVAKDEPRTALEAIEGGLRQTRDLTDEGKRQILDFAKRIAEKHTVYGEKADKEGEGKDRREEG